MTADEHRSLRGEFFDVDFSDDEAEKRAMGLLAAIPTRAAPREQLSTDHLWGRYVVGIVPGPPGAHHRRV